MTKPTWIIFDIGGVLFDYMKAFEAIQDYLGVDGNYVKQIIDSQIGNEERGSVTFESVWTQILNPIGKISELDHVTQMWYSPEFWLLDTIALMSELQQAGYHVGIMTNNWGNMTEHILAFPGINIVEKLYESSVVGMRKPDLEFYNYIRDDLQVQESELFLIDDLVKNIEGAKLAGWQSFQYEIGTDNGQAANQTLRTRLL
jgi:putative hydrolase of the HAD superfamily